jgi:uncharacterized protein (DUF885 family)
MPTSTARRPLPALLLALAAALASCATTPVTPPAATPGASSRSSAALALHALFERSWDDAMRRHPEWATSVGDDRYGDRLTDASPDAEAAEFTALRQDLAAARAIDRAALDTTDRTSLDLFIQSSEDELAVVPLVGWRRMTLGSQDGFHLALDWLLRATPVDSTAQAQQLLSRMAAYPRRVDQELVRLREGMALGWVAARPVLDRVIDTLDKQLTAPPDQGPFFEPFTRLGNAIPAAERAALQAQARTLITTQLLPAQRRLRDFAAGPYAAAAPAAGNLNGYPGGAEVYTMLVRNSTTTTLSPAQIHAIGLREVARLRGEIAQVMQRMQWRGDFASFVQHLNTDPRYFHTSPEALLAGYRDIGKRLDAELPKLFAELPRAPWGVRPMPEAMGPDAAESYDNPGLEGRRPGWFNANVVGFRTRPIWSLETLVAHEAVPGHHLQIARANELRDLPRFRRAAGYTAYTEGWALYAETLGFEMGLYQDPASHFGHLQWQMARAVRLVIDTGLHQLGWTRQQAIDLMRTETGLDSGTVEAEVDRYMSWPAQALGYMVGQLKLIELRDRARAALGERFDIRRFHNLLLDQGALPLTVLERQVDSWIAAEQAAPARR